MRSSFQAPDAFSGDEDDNGDNNDATHQVTLKTTPEESRLTRVKSRYERFRSPVQRYWRSQWPLRICSMLCCLVILSFIGVFSSFLYVILKDLRAERVTTEDGTEVRLLGFWSMFVLSSLVGVLCCSFSWTLTYFDSFEPGMFPPTPLSPAKFSQVCLGKDSIFAPRPLKFSPYHNLMEKPEGQMTGHSFHMGYSMAILNGIVAGLTFFWCLI